jgi:hypothetical protein
MGNFICGIVAAALLATGIDAIDSVIPNSVMYYLDLWIPFI